MALLPLPEADQLQLMSQHILRPDLPAFMCSSQAFDRPGIYALFNRQDQLLYIGKSRGVSRRIRQYTYERRLGGSKADWDCFTVSYAPESMIATLESAHIEALDPPLNRKPELCSAPCSQALAAVIRNAWGGAIRSGHG